MDKYLACFDISDDKSRLTIGKLLSEYGSRVQHSVFEIAISDDDDKTQLHELCEQANQWLEDEDSLYFYRLCESCCAKSIDSRNVNIAQFSGVVIL